MADGGIMTIREEMDIHRLPSFVWPYLTNANLIAQWNTKIRSISPHTPGPFRPHYTFDLTMLLRDKEKQLSAEVTELVENQRIVIVMQSQEGDSTMQASETYTLKPTRNGTHLERVIDAPAVVMPWWARMLIWLISKFGKPTEETGLQRLARLVEKGAQ